jgi:hypothetical protein
LLAQGGSSDHLTPGVHTSSCSCPPPARRLRPPTRHPPQHHPHPPRCARASALDKPGMFSLLYGLFEYLFRKVHDPAALRCCHVLTWPYKDATGTDAPHLLRIRPAARETLQGRACEVARPSLSRTHCACLLTIHARLGFTPPGLGLSCRHSDGMQWCRLTSVLWGVRGGTRTHWASSVDPTSDQRCLGWAGMPCYTQHTADTRTHPAQSCITAHGTPENSDVGRCTRAEGRHCRWSSGC